LVDKNVCGTPRLKKNGRGTPWVTKMSIYVCMSNILPFFCILHNINGLLLDNKANGAIIK
jgi:hypothetical protein